MYKVGDRVFDSWAKDKLERTGFGTITEIVFHKKNYIIDWDDSIDPEEDRARDFDDKDLILEYVYNSPLFGLMSEED